MAPLVLPHLEWIAHLSHIPQSTEPCCRPTGPRSRGARGTRGRTGARAAGTSVRAAGTSVRAAGTSVRAAGKVRSGVRTTLLSGHYRQGTGELNTIGPNVQKGGTD